MKTFLSKQSCWAVTLWEMSSFPLKWPFNLRDWLITEVLRILTPAVCFINNYNLNFTLSQSKAFFYVRCQMFTRNNHFVEIIIKLLRLIHTQSHKLSVLSCVLFIFLGLILCPSLVPDLVSQVVHGAWFQKTALAPVDTSYMICRSASGTGWSLGARCYTFWPRLPWVSIWVSTFACHCFN